MTNQLNFKPKYAPKVLAFDPAFSKYGGCGLALINTDAEIFGGIPNKPFIHKCGLLTPFSNESCLQTMNDLCRKLTEIWRYDAGYVREPMMLIVERPVNYPGSPVRFGSIEKLNIFVGMILKSLNPKFQISPDPNEWKGRKKKEDTEAEIMSLLNFNDRKALERDLENIKTSQRHNVFDAIGLGIYAARVLNKKIPPPQMLHTNEDARFYESLRVAAR